MNSLGRIVGSALLSATFAFGCSSAGDALPSDAGTGSDGTTTGNMTGSMAGATTGSTTGATSGAATGGNVDGGASSGSADAAGFADTTGSADAVGFADATGSADATGRTDGPSGISGDSGFSKNADSGGTTTAVTGPCDIYASGGAPCVAAYSTVRALYGNFSGHLYRVTRASDATTKDIGVLSTGGFADSAAQDTFCAGTTCTISIIYDQSPKGNDLTPGPAGGHVPTPDKPANATALSTTASGHTVYGVLITPGMGYRIDKTSGVATGDEPETEYMVTSSNHLVNGCCFDYGNAETNNRDDGNGTMEAVYFGLGANQGSGTGSGPWVEADLENGVWAGGGNDPVKGVPTNTPLTSAYVTAMVVGRSGTFALKGGNAQTGTLTTMYDGARPNGSYNPMKKQGAIILGIGGDNSDSGGGEFYEGVITSGNASAAADDAVQANIVGAGYGH